MTILTEGKHTGAFIKELVSSTLCFEEINVTSGNFEAGAVLSLTDGKWGAADATAEAHCVLMRGVDASTEDQTSSGLMRLAVVKADHLEWPANFAAADKTTIITSMKTVMLLVQ